MNSITCILTFSILVTIFPVAEDSPGPNASAPAATADEQTAEEILRRADDFMGGREKLDTLTKRWFRGQTVSSGVTTLLQFASSAPSKLYFETRREGSEIVDAKMGTNGEVFWVFDPRFGGYRLATEGMLRSFSENADLVGMVVDLRRRFPTIGKPQPMTFEGRDGYGIKMRNTQGSNPTVVFDRETGRPLGYVFTQYIRNEAIEQRLIFDDWKEVPGTEVRMFHKLSMQMPSISSITTLTEIKFHEVDESLFLVPEEAQRIVDNPNAPVNPMPMPGDSPKPVRPAAPVESSPATRPARP